MTRFLLSAAVLGPMLLACAPQPAPDESGRTIPREVSCIDVSRIVSRRPDGPRSLRFEMTGGTDYRNELTEACAPLEHATDFDILSLELHGSQLCTGDRFRIVDPSEARAVGLRAFPECRLGRFVPIVDGR